MKKTYINPTIDNAQMDVEEMIAASPDGFNKTLDNENTISPDEMLSRRSSVWDDEAVGEDF